MSSLTNLGSIIWNWSHQNAAFSEKKSPIWHIKSQRMGCNPVTQTWKQSQIACCLKLTQRCMPSSVWRATTGGSSKGLHTCTAIQQIFGWRRGQQEVRVGVSYRRCLEGFWSIEVGMYDSLHFGFCWLHKAVLFGDWCINGWTGGSAFTEAGRQTVPPCCLW